MPIFDVPLVELPKSLVIKFSLKQKRDDLKPADTAGALKRALTNALAERDA